MPKILALVDVLDERPKDGFIKDLRQAFLIFVTVNGGSRVLFVRFEKPVVFGGVVGKHARHGQFIVDIVVVVGIVIEMVIVDTSRFIPQLGVGGSYQAPFS